MSSWSKLLTVSVLGGTSLFAFLLMSWVTLDGIGVSPDSVHYLEVSRNLLEGNGFYDQGWPVLNWPPAYPVLLAAAQIVHNNQMVSVRGLHLVLYSMSCLLLGLVAHSLTGRSRLGLLCAIVLFLSSGFLLEIYAMAWSEPAFIFFSVGAMFLISRYIEHPKRVVLVIAALLLSSAMTTRYVGITLLPPVLACLIFLGDRDLRRRVLDAGFLLVVACTPIGIWFLRNLIVAANLTGKESGSRPIEISVFKELGYKILDFWLPADIQRELMLVPLALLGILFLAGLAGNMQQRLRIGSPIDSTTAFQVLTLLFLAVYVSFVGFSSSVLDAAVGFDERILSPLHVFSLLLLTSVCFGRSNVSRGYWSWICLACLGFTVVTNGNRTAVIAKSIREEGRWFTSRSWRNSETLAFVENAWGERKIYSNGVDVIFFRLGEAPLSLPMKSIPFTTSPNLDFTSSLETLCEDVRKNGALVVYFDDVDRRYLASHEDLGSQCELRLIRTFADGQVYGPVVPYGEVQEPRSLP
jgi:hypothetical protein